MNAPTGGAWKFAKLYLTTPDGGLSAQAGTIVDCREKKQEELPNVPGVGITFAEEDKTAIGADHACRCTLGFPPTQGRRNGRAGAKKSETIGKRSAPEVENRQA